MTAESERRAEATVDLTPAQDRCVHCAELGHSDCVRGAYRFGVLTGREAAARAIEAGTAMFCMDGVGRHLVEVCIEFARGDT